MHPQHFEALFGIPPQAIAQAPGRVNLMGEHTDYNQGWVLPTILPHQTQVQIAMVPHVESFEPHIDTFSATCQDRAQFTLYAPSTGQWTDYIQACLQQLHRHSVTIPSLKIWVESTLPMGAGVASSAALEVAVLKAMRSLLKLDLSDGELALMAQQAEVEGVGMPCGVMDQMVTALGQRDHAFFLDTQTISFEQVPLPTQVAFVVVHSGTSHTLVTSGYQQRRQECEAAAAQLQRLSLRDATLAEVEQSALPRLLRQRARHVITENQRVLATVAAFKADRIADVGPLMNASHLSQKT